MENLDKEQIIWNVNVFILFLYAVDIFGFPNKIAIIWIGLVGVYYWKNRTAVIVDAKTILLMLGMFGHAIIFKCYKMDFSITLTLSLGVIPVLFYLLGRQLVGNLSKASHYEYRSEFITLAIVMGMFVHALLNFYAWLQEHNGKLWDDFWPDNLCVATTTHSFLAVGAGALIAYGIYYMTKKWYYSILILFVALIANVINIIYDNRMVLSITILILGMNALIYVYLNRKSKKTWYIAVLVLIVLMIILGLVFGLNIGNIKGSLYFQNFMTRDGGIIKNVRFQIQAKAISQLLSHWKGGVTMELLGFGSTHNYWLDLANHTGLLPFILMVLFTFSAIKDMVLLILSNDISTKLKYLLPSVFMSFFLYHCVEPGGIVRPDYILYLTIMAGVIYQTRKCANEEKLCSINSERG